jgi:hypothetical protein
MSVHAPLSIGSNPPHQSHIHVNHIETRNQASRGHNYQNIKTQSAANVVAAQKVGSTHFTDKKDKEIAQKEIAFTSTIPLIFGDELDQKAKENLAQLYDKVSETIPGTDATISLTLEARQAIDEFLSVIPANDQSDSTFDSTYVTPAA